MGEFECWIIPFFNNSCICRVTSDIIFSGILYSFKNFGLKSVLTGIQCCTPIYNPGSSLNTSGYLSNTANNCCYSYSVRCDSDAGSMRSLGNNTSTSGKLTTSLVVQECMSPKSRSRSSSRIIAHVAILAFWSIHRSEAFKSSFSSATGLLLFNSPKLSLSAWTKSILVKNRLNWLAWSRDWIQSNSTK